jgi:hypothetical protein
LLFCADDKKGMQVRKMRMIHLGWKKYFIQDSGVLVKYNIAQNYKIRHIAVKIFFDTF